MSRHRLLSSHLPALVVLLLVGSVATAFAGVLSMTKTGPGGVKPGEEAVYTIVVSNTGPGDIAGVALDDPTPSGLGLVSVSGDCAAFPCGFATLAADTTKTVTVRFTVPGAYNGPNPIVNVAVAGTSGTDGVTATASTAVTRIAGLHTLPPCRIVDTRLTTGVPIGGPALAAGTVRTVNVREACGLPGNATAIAFNLTVTGPTSAGNLRISPGGTSVSSSAINYATGQTRANNGIVPLSAEGALSVQCDQATGTTQLILDVNGYFTSTDAVATPAGQSVKVRPAPEVEITFDNVTQAGVTTARVIEFADNRTATVHQNLKAFFPAGSVERALVPSVIIPSFIKPLGKGGPAGPPTFVLSIVSTTAKFTRTAEFHGFEDFRLGWDPPCIVAADPTQEPRTFYAREAPKNEPALAEEMAFGGPVFVDISSGCGSNKGSGWNFSLYLTATDTRTPQDIALYMLNSLQTVRSDLASSITDANVASALSAAVTAALANLGTSPAVSLAKTTEFIGLVDGNPNAFDNTARNVSGELVGRAQSARYMIGKFVPAEVPIAFESAVLGPTGQGFAGTLAFNTDQFLGARFHLNTPVQVSAIGGHMIGSSPPPVFGSIVRLASPSALPSGLPFDGSTLATTTFTPGSPSSDFRTPLSVVLAPGDYALIFGCVTGGGLATCGGMPPNNADLPGSSYFFWNGNNWQNGGSGTRFVVVGGAPN